MVRGTRYSCTSGMHHGLASVSIFCFIYVVNVAVGQNVQLQVLPQSTAQCGDNVTLTCNFNSSNQNDIKLMDFSLLPDNKPKKCDFKHNQDDREFRCEITNKTSHKTISMVLTNIMPLNEGKYICKVDTNKGSKNYLTYVTVQDCFGVSDSSRNSSHATCSFSGFYPSGVVLWFRGPDNVTDKAITKEERDQHGLYNVESVIRVEEDKLNHNYNCSLWIPSINKYVSPVMSAEIQKTQSSGVTVKLQWVCIALEIVLLIYKM